MTKKRAVTGAMLLALLAAGAGLWLLNDRRNTLAEGPQQPTNTNPSSAEPLNDQLTSGEQKGAEKTPEANKPQAEQPAQSQPQQEQPEPVAPTIKVSMFGQVGQTVKITGIIEGMSAGTCQATFTGPQGTLPFARTKPITKSSDLYKCDIDIDVSEFSVGGQWKMSFFAGDASSKTNVEERTIQIIK